MASRLLLIRHADTGPANRERLVGSTDISASPAGLDAVGRLAAVLERFSPESWYCSPMLRARQTAERLGPGPRPPDGMILDERLREIDFGSWEMRRLADILSSSDPDLITSWSAYESFVFPGGEAVSAFGRRVADIFSLVREAEGREICLVTHGGVIRTMICQALGLPANHYLLFDIRPATLTVLDLYSEGGVLSGLNL
ncbi:Alpha-ribazole-5'-phosphate phosphatase [hydrothermal vent metagenome]|uniref:Alpha-ribazole-5'-phosphate phosphatase n=1 Tax=hydrothermal vent metagenome TaxID=652676 RepID=A0A3B0US61_9ZZZZ